MTQAPVHGVTGHVGLVIQHPGQVDRLFLARSGQTLHQVRRRHIFDRRGKRRGILTFITGQVAILRDTTRFCRQKRSAGPSLVRLV